MRPRTRTSSFFLTSLWALDLLLCAAETHAAVPHLIRYQGVAVDSQQVPLEGPYTITFRLYNAVTAGTKVWEEVQQNIPVTKGHFSVLLGQVTSLDAIDWTQPLWLSIQIGTDPELTPHQQITSVPLAIRAEVAERLTIPVTTSTIMDDANRLMPSGAIILWDGTACPSGYSRLASYDDRFLVGSATAGIGGGSNTHTHGAGSYTTPNHTHSVPNAGWPWAEGSPPVSTGTLVTFSQSGHDQHSTGNQTTGSGGGGAISGSSALADSRPAFKTILLCKKD